VDITVWAPRQTDVNRVAQLFAQVVVLINPITTYSRNKRIVLAPKLRPTLCSASFPNSVWEREQTNLHLSD